MNADQVNGYIDIAVGKMEELVGWVLRLPIVRHRGQRDQIVGHARASYGKAIAAVLRRAHRGLN
jgi:uncharacterized protein YjbJ (UPF0337 family)